MKMPILLRRNLPALGLILVGLLLSTRLVLSQDEPTTGRIIVDLWAYPRGDTYSFDFDASGGAYADFSLTDASPPNEQELAPGTYSLSIILPEGWSIHDGLSPICRSSLGGNDEPTDMQLDAGETLSCTFYYEKDEIPMELDLNVQTEWLHTAYNWSINKEVSPQEVHAEAGQTVTFTYTVHVDVSMDNSESRIFGTMRLYNPSPWVRSYTINATIAGSIPVEVLCYEDEFSGPTDIVQAEEANDCVFSLPTNGPEYEGETLSVSVTTTGFPPAVTSTASEVIEWSDAPSSVTGYAQVDIFDDLDARFGGDDAYWNFVSEDSSFPYATSFICWPDAEAYGEHEQVAVTFNNTATIVQTGASASVSATVWCHAPVVVEQCTYGQGYWRSHSEAGNAPYDDAWLGFDANGANAIFFLSEMSFYEVISTPPAGNVYYQLARQYIAAKLNMMNGAPFPQEVSDAVIWAEIEFFSVYSPNDVPRDLRDTARNYATTLENYNSGLIGPGQCSE